MDYPVEHPRFQARKLVVRSGIVGNTTLVLDGETVSPTKRSFFVQDDSGESVEVKFAANLGGVPKVIVDGGAPMDVAPPLPWFAWVFAFVPFLLIPLGGALGGMLGFLACTIVLGLFRSDQPMGLKIAGSIGITIFSGVTYIIVGVALHLIVAIATGTMPGG